MKYFERAADEKEALARSVVEYMNDLLRIDPEAIVQLCESRVLCNDALRDHPTVQVATDENPTPDGTSARVGLLGILNGFIGTRPEGHGYLMAVYEDDGTISRFELTGTHYP
jgi:hypothetical protein